MKIPTKKLQNGFEMPIFGMGTWQMGGKKEIDPNNDDKADIQAIQKAVELGITLIDTAATYAAGHTEEIVGQAIKELDRSKLFVVSKVPPPFLTREGVIKSAKESLKRLNTDYFDLFLIHSPNPEIPIKETMQGMNDLLKIGLTRNIGVCNFTIERFEEAQQHASIQRLQLNQLHYNLMFREPERKGLVKYCQENDVFLQAWRPVQKGILTNPGNAVVDAMCQKYRKTPSQIAINWLISQKNVITLSKMRNEEHIKENLTALDWAMDDLDIAKLDKEFPNQKDVSDAVPLI